jgi:DNA replication protein DnaC
MGQPIDMTAILDKINQRGLFQSITRYQYLPYDMNLAMQVVDAIGKKRNPKFQIDSENRFTYENMIRWIHADPDMKRLDAGTKQEIPGRLNAGIYIAGKTGSGKSWTLEIMTAYCLIDNVQIVLGETKRHLHWSNIRIDAICDEYTAGRSLERFKKMNIIGIQDLGAEPAESMHMGNRINVMRQILEHRGDHTDQLTLITSNLPVNHKRLVDRYDDRVASRLCEMCNYFEITGKDRRKI